MEKRIKNGGFTIVELLVAIGILIIVGSIISGAIMFSLRGANKANSMEQLRQTGDFVINQLVKTVTNAKTFDGVSDNSIDFSPVCEFTSPPTPPHPYRYLKITRFDNASVLYDCTLSTFRINGTDVFNPSAVVLSKCSIACSQKDLADIPTISISFTLSSTGNTSLVENSTSIDFKTSVVPRNYKNN